MSDSYPIRGALARQVEAEPHTDVDEERVLLQRTRSGDLAAFDQLVRRYLPRAYATAWRLLKNREDAEDLVQDAFMRALRHIHQFDMSRRFGPWFFRLLTNTGLNAMERRAVRTMETEEENLPSSGVTPDVVVEQGEIRERFSAALAALPPRQRMIVGLYDVEGVPTAEIAERLGIGAETVRWHLFQARRTLRRALASLRPR
jgi:RNA polymerase sigma-70 factor (ECF subfamily)